MEKGSSQLLDMAWQHAVAAHELKSPLALIRQLALQLQTTPGDSQTDVMLSQIILTAERSLRLTSDLTYASNLQPELFPCEPVNVLQICEDVAHELTPLYAAHDRTIRVTRRRQAPLVIAHRDLLRRVLLNFGDNALHYTDTATPTELQVTRMGSVVRLGVRDGGPRPTSPLMPSGMLTGRPQGSGLGLMITRNFAELMNGTIGVMRHQRGTTFYIDMMISEQMSLL
jgi:signal transduction histidine kinase